MAFAFWKKIILTKEVDASVLEKHMRAYTLKATGIGLNIQKRNKLYNPPQWLTCSS